VVATSHRATKMCEMLSPISDKSDPCDQCDPCDPCDPCQQQEQPREEEEAVPKKKEAVRRPLSLVASKRHIFNDPATSLRMLNDPAGASMRMALNGSDSGISISANSLFSQHEALTMHVRDAEHLSLDNSRGNVT